MRTLSKFLLVALMSYNFMDVKIYGTGCHLDASYMADQIYINPDKAYIDITMANGEMIHVPFAYGVTEVQVSFKEWFRSYVLENGKIVEKKTPFCQGSI